MSFAATSVGTYSATLNVQTDASGGTGTVALTGTATPHGTITLPSTLSIVAPTSGGISQPLTLSNTGTVVVNIAGMTIAGTNASNFTETTTCAAQLPAGGSCTITVTFASGTIGSYTGALNIQNDATVGGVATVALTGTAAAPNPVVSLTASTLTFPSMVAGINPGTPQVVTLKNTGGLPLTLTSIASTGTSAGVFPVTNTCGTTVAAGASCTITSGFGPKVAGTYAGSIAVTDNAPGSPQTIALSGVATPATITINTTTATDWKIDNGAISLDWNSTAGRIFGMTIDGTTDQLVDVTSTTGSPSQPQGFYMDNAGLGSGTNTAQYTLGPNGSYLDWSITTSSNSANAYTESEHFIVYPNDPGFHTYYVLNHGTSDIAGSVGQIQWVFRDNLTQFTNTYEVNPSVNSPGVTTTTMPLSSEMFNPDPGRAVQDATNDLHGFTDLPANWTRKFYTKYDHAGYEYMHQAHGMFGSTYGVWTVLPKSETLIGGPTKQDLYFTGNLDMIEAYSNHEVNGMSLNTAAGAAYQRLFGPFYVHFNTFGQTANNQSGNTIQTPADMYADAVAAGASYASQYDSDAQLTASGYVKSTARGSVSIQVNGVTGTARTAWAVLSDPKVNFQYSSTGYQYWADISNNGSATISGVVPGTYRLSVYVLGQWGELRQDNIAVTANQTTIVPAVTFVPENFGTGTPVFTIGTPDRSSHEFLHGHFANGNDDREFWGAWNYWADFSATNGAVVYNATNGPAGNATNDLTKWNYAHWGGFDPGLFGGVYSTSDDTTDGYTYAIPSYVATLTGHSGTNGVTTGVPAWTVHFATPASQTGSTAQSYVVLSGSLACMEASYVVTLNGSQLIFHNTNASDCMVRSGLSGYTQWFAMQWPASVLSAAGLDNVMTIGVSQTNGVEEDALRLELTNNSAAPSSTGWNDYTYVPGSTSTAPNDAVPNP